MLRMFQKVMLGEKNERFFADVNFNEGLVMVIIIGVLCFSDYIQNQSSI